MSELAYVLEPQSPADAEAIARLNDRVFGPGRFARTAYRLREETPPDLALSCVAWIGSLLVGANAMTHIVVGETPALLLGPLIVEPVFRSRGIGEALVTRSLDCAREAGSRLVLLVGDEPYYGRMGFLRTPAGRIQFPGPVDPARLLYCELQPGAIEGVSGKVRGA
jgi:predicted N-acetyltransferase YhbS